jgi:hypothetical protein
MWLGNAPLITVNLIRAGDLRDLLLFRIHHIIADEWSMGLLLGEVAETYGLILGGDGAFLNDPPIQYADFAEWEDEWAARAECLSNLDYWKAKLTPLPPPVDLPYDYALTPDCISGPRERPV